MINLILFILSTMGLTHILVDSSIFGWVKGWKIWKFINNLTKNKYYPNGLFDWVKEALECYQCSGMYSGMFCGLILIDFQNNLFNIIITILLAGFAGSWLGIFSKLFTSFIEARTIIALSDYDLEKDKK